MRRLGLLAVVGVLAVLIVPAFAQESGFRLETMDTGQVVAVPDGAVLTPGIPAVVPRALLEETEASRQSLATLGYIEVQDHLPEVDVVLATISRRNQEEGSFSAIGVEDLVSNPGKAAGLGKVDEIYLAPNSGQLMYRVGTAHYVRIYTDTVFGKLMIREFDRADVRAGGRYNYTVAGYPANKSVLRYPGERWVTVVLVSNGTRALLVQASSRIVDHAEDAEFRQFLANLLTQS